MKYLVLITDGAADWPLASHGGKTCLELAQTPNLDALAREGTVGHVRTVPPGMEPSSACACMSLLGYDPRVYYKGRGSIEARSMELPVGEGEVVFRCNLVSTHEGRMESYSCGYISNDEAHELIDALNHELGDEEVSFYPGVSYRHICRIRGHEETLLAHCTPAHDIPGGRIEQHLPEGKGSEYLRRLMERSKAVLKDHPVNVRRLSRGELPATMIWLFWGSGQIPAMPAFLQEYGLSAAMTSGVDLLLGLAKMAGMRVLSIPGVTGDIANDYVEQMRGSIEGLETSDLVVVHVEAPDEAGHDGSVKDKVEAIERIDADMVAPVRSLRPGQLRVLVAPDHPTPIEVQTHVSETVPFIMWGPGFAPNGAFRFTENEGKRTGLLVDPGYGLMRRFTA
jgi:2,3-bisphosphoglycerate-independent phosphoglycerate mutase